MLVLVSSVLVLVLSVPVPVPSVPVPTLLVPISNHVNGAIFPCRSSASWFVSDRMTETARMRMRRMKMWGVSRPNTEPGHKSSGHCFQSSPLCTWALKTECRQTCLVHISSLSRDIVSSLPLPHFMGKWRTPILLFELPIYTAAYSLVYVSYCHSCNGKTQPKVRDLPKPNPICSWQPSLLLIWGRQHGNFLSF